MRTKRWWEKESFLKGKKFESVKDEPSWEEKQRRVKAGDYTPGRYDLRPGWDYMPHGLPRKAEEHVRFIQVGNTFYCELWMVYAPTRTGRFGRARSVLVSRFTKVRTGRPNNFKYGLQGDTETYFWSGGVMSIKKVAPGTANTNTRTSLRIDLTPKGQVELYEDRTRGEFNPRILGYKYFEDGRRELTRKRTKMKDTEMQNRWGSSGNIVRRFNRAGAPLLDDGDFVRQVWDGDTLAVEVNHVGGRPHGRESYYNKSGRRVDEKFFHHGTDIPRWVFEKPEDIKVEEILEERNTEVRRAMLELQGFEVFLARAKDAGLVRVINEDEDDRVGVLLQIELPGLSDATDFQKSSKEFIDGHLFTLLKVKDGTLDKHYILRVPNDMKTARQANAWTWGLTEQEYSPAIER